MKYFLVILWIPIGNLYMVAMKIYRSGETWKGLFTKRIYRAAVIDSGIFGPATPLMDMWLEKAMPRNKVQGNVIEHDFSKTVQL